jgi:hypothetical protein
MNAQRHNRPWAGAMVLVAVLSTVGFALGSCATKKTLAWSFTDIDPAWLAADDRDDVAGIVLLAEHRYVFQKLGLYGAGRTEVHFHLVQKLLTEAGIDAMASTVPWPKRGTLLHLDARTIAPDGTVTPMTEEQLFVDEASYGRDELGREVGQNLRRFTFPRLEVGSVLELSWAFEMPGLYTGWSDTNVLDELPTKTYRVEIVVEPAAQPDLMIVNHTVPPKFLPSTDGMQHLVFELHDLPARRREAFQPSRRATEPWWIYRTIAYRYPNNVLEMNATWDDTVAGRVGALVRKGEGAEGVALPKDGPACAGDQGCIVDFALDHVRDATVWTGFDDAFDFRAPRDVVPSGWASAADKAALLTTLLVAAGVDARLAALARANTNEVERSFPHLAWLNHTLVVARIGGEDVWLDPSCDFCRRGELPSWSRDRDALVVSAGDNGVKTEWRRATGRAPAVLGVRRRTYAVTLRDDGSADVDHVLVTGGEQALESCRATRDWRDDDWRNLARQTVSGWSRAGELVAHEPGRCDRAAGAWQRSLRATVPSLAVRSGGELIVPLRLLPTPVELPRRAPRVADFVVPSSTTWDDELRLLPPPGFVFANVPDAFEKKDDGALVRFEVRRDGAALVLRRVVELAAGTTPKAGFPRVRAVLAAAEDLAQRSVVLVKAPD